MMDHEFWHTKWATNKIGFHLEDIHPLLKRHWASTNASKESSVLVPLCGKSEDLDWLAERHQHVVGVELSDIAVKSYFAQRFYTPTVTQLDSFNCLYQFDELSIYQGDVFKAPLPSVDIVYDRAALIALPLEVRAEYAQRLLSLVNPGGSILLISVEHNLDKPSPPFSVEANEIRTIFVNCDCRELEYVALPDDKVDGERVWLIRPNSK
ncbi:thiopurine S-methyltransferase [Vibrio sp. WJH972]